MFLKIIISFHEERQMSVGHLAVIKAGIYSAYIARCHDNQQSGSIDQVLPLLHDTGTIYLFTHVKI